MAHKTRIARALDDGTLDRRSFVKLCSAAAAAVGLSSTAATQMAQAMEKGVKPSVIWMHFQECTGCTESLLRTSHPGLAELILDLISLDYHETLFAAAGHQIEDVLHETMEKHRGEYICVIEGSIPLAADGAYCKIAGRTALDLANEVAADAAATIAIGSCASWGGPQSAPPNPTGATGAPEVLEGLPVVALPGCPTNPYNFLGVVMQYVTYGTLPELDHLSRPISIYGRTIHDHCPRRPHFDAGRFAEQFGDAGHKSGWCLYRLGCKGPETHANCATRHFGEIAGAWPIGAGHPCVGCTEKGLAFATPIHQQLPLDLDQDDRLLGLGPAGLGVAGVAGLAAGGVAGVAVAGARRNSRASAPPAADEAPAEDKDKREE
jgi:hydrogenase small subunit